MRRGLVPTAHLLLATLLLAVPAARAETLGVKSVELNVQIDPGLQTLYAKARLVLRNDGQRAVETVDLQLPPALGPQSHVVRVWDREGELAWRSDPPNPGRPRSLLVALRSPLKPGKKTVLVANYEVDFEGADDAAAGAQVTNGEARLNATGWYPVPADPRPAVPEVVKLEVRLPKDWRVSAPVTLKQQGDGASLAIYELKLEHVQPGGPLFRASAPP